MWQLDNRTPFAAERTWVRDRDGTEIWLVAVKASFSFDRAGRLRVADEQPPVTLIPDHLGAPGASSLRFETDLPRTKLTTDILVVGQAHAPEGRAAHQLDVGLAVGPVSKVLRVFGDRCWVGRRISDPVPFTSLPLVYERAYGGRDPRGAPGDWDARNPVGRGYYVSAEHASGQALPNVEDPRRLISRWDDRPPPAGLGPLACHWLARQAFAGTYDERWQAERLPLLPEDFDDRHYQCAPSDQWAPEFLRGGEPVLLRHLCPGGGELRLNLPRLFLGFETFFYTGPNVRHPAPRLHSVIFEPDAWRLALVWHSALPCHPRVLKLKSTRITLKQDVRESTLAKPAALESA